MFVLKGIGATVSTVINQKDFFNDPHQCSKGVWERFEKKIAANGAVRQLLK